VSKNHKKRKQKKNNIRKRKKFNFKEQRRKQKQNQIGYQCPIFQKKSNIVTNIWMITTSIVMLFFQRISLKKCHAIGSWTKRNGVLLVFNRAEDGNIMKSIAQSHIFFSLEEQKDLILKLETLLLDSKHLIENQMLSLISLSLSYSQVISFVRNYSSFMVLWFPWSSWRLHFLLNCIFISNKNMLFKNLKWLSFQND